jgi:hypothetical protein
MCHQLHIFDAKWCKTPIINSYHECDSWEDIFRDYDIKMLEDKAVGGEIAVKEITAQINGK